MSTNIDEKNNNPENAKQNKNLLFFLRLCCVIAAIWLLLLSIRFVQEWNMNRSFINAGAKEVIYTRNGDLVLFYGAAYEQLRGLRSADANATVVMRTLLSSAPSEEEILWRENPTFVAWLAALLSLAGITAFIGGIQIARLKRVGIPVFFVANVLILIFSSILWHGLSPGFLLWLLLLVIIAGIVWWLQQKTMIFR